MADSTGPDRHPAVQGSLYDELIYGTLTEATGEKKRYTVDVGANDEPVYLDVHTNMKRELALQEIMDTEKTYINNVLTVLHEGFFVKVMRHHEHFTSDSVKVIFSNIIEIHQVHAEWLKNLEMVCRKKTGKEKKQARIVSQVFSEFSENLKCYTEFCGMATSGMDLVTKLLKSKKVAAILEECRQESGQRFTLKDLLPVMSQRIMKYPMLLEALHKATPDGHPDKVALLSTMENMTVLTKYINDVKVEKDIVREFQARLKDHKGEPLVLLGKLFFRVNCGLLTVGKKVADTKIEAVTVWMFQKGLLLCKYGWKDLKSKQPKAGAPALTIAEQDTLYSSAKVSFEHFFDLIKVQSITQLSPAGMPDVPSVQTNFLDADSLTSGWTVETQVKGGATEVHTFVATRENQKQFVTKYGGLSGDGIRPTSQAFKVNQQSWNFPRSAVVQGVMLGKGNFGEVYKGTLSGKVTIAVKTFRAGVADSSEFTQEIETLASITKSMHEHLLQFYGIVPPETTEDGKALPMMMLTEYLDLGSLKSYLQGFQLKRSQKRFQDLARYAGQIANGMAHLESVGFVHRDLAARNVLVGSGENDGQGEICKIADFGLSKVLNKDGRYLAEAHAQLPYKWTAPEGLDEDDPVFSTKTDVWSFGVLLCEIFTYGDDPYREIRDPQVLLEALQGDQRLQSPPGLPVPFYEKMLGCWRADPAARPSFKELDGWFRRYWAVTDMNGLYAVGYSRDFCRRASDERGGAIRKTARYLYSLINTEFEMKQASAHAQKGPTFVLRLTSPGGGAALPFPEPSIHVLTVERKRRGYGHGGDGGDMGESAELPTAASPERASGHDSSLSTEARTTATSPLAQRGRQPTVSARSRMAGLFANSPTQSRKALHGGMQASAPDSGSLPTSPLSVSTSPAPASSPYANAATTSSGLFGFDANEFSGFESDEDADPFRWQMRATTGSTWEDMPGNISFAIEQRYVANCGDAEFALGGSRFKVDFGFMKQFRVDNPSITREVRRTNDLSI